MASSVTLKQIAEEAGVSIGTVSRVLNNHENVTYEMRERVVKEATRLGYFSVGERSRSHDNSYQGKDIGFLFCSSTTSNTATANPFWSHILHGVEDEASKRNARVTYRSLIYLQDTPDVLLTTIYEMKLGGILLVGPATLATVRLLQSTGIPLVLVDHFVPQTNSVLGNNFEGARDAVQYLISLGHRQIAFIGGPTEAGVHPVNTIYSIERRAEGYRMALMDAGLPVPYECYESSFDLGIDGGYEACKRLLKHKRSFSAIFCANDETAIGAIKALRENALRVPEDVSVIGFDDIDMAKHVFPALTTMHINKEALGFTAVKRLFSLMHDPDPFSVSSILEVELVVRDSVTTRLSKGTIDNH